MAATQRVPYWEYMRQEQDMTVNRRKQHIEADTAALFKDNINNPEHYTLGKIEVYDFIKAWELEFSEGNIVKYVVRSPYKGKRLDDLKKARWYLNKLIEDAENEG